MIDFKGRDIQKTCTILSALKQMDNIDRKLLVVMDKDVFLGLLSIGDIQRAIINDINIENAISEILRENFIVASPDDTIKTIKELMLKNRMELCPVLDDNGDLIKIYFWEDWFGNNQLNPKKKFDLPIVIMAGGFGTRMKPLTNVIPKPLIPIGEETILEDILSKFAKHGSTRFYLSLNYKAELIEFYLRNKKLPYTLNFFTENKPMGTAGSLSLLKGKINSTFFVSNCDIIIDQDYSDILEYHKTNKNEITVVAALKHYSISYGTLTTGENGELKSLIEKPEFTFKINSGMYVLEPHLIDEIPDCFFHITHLIDNIKKRGGRVGVFPISEKSWKDIGEMHEYLSLINIGSNKVLYSF